MQRDDSPLNPADSNPTTSLPEPELARWRRAGAQAGEELDSRLREVEHRGRVARAMHFAPPSPSLNPAPTPPNREETWRLACELEIVRAFQERVFRSRGWRVLQALRRPFGRAW